MSIDRYLCSDHGLCTFLGAPLSIEGALLLLLSSLLLLLAIVRRLLSWPIAACILLSFFILWQSSTSVPKRNQAKARKQCFSWEDRIWPSPANANFNKMPRLPDLVVASMGRVDDYYFTDYGFNHKHTNPVLMARRRDTDEEVIFKVRVQHYARSAYAMDGGLTLDGFGGFGEESVLSHQWAKCTARECPEAALKLGGGALDRLRRVPFHGVEFAKMQAAAGVGDMRDELFVNSMLAPNLCSLPDGITPLLDVYA